MVVSKLITAGLFGSHPYTQNDFATIVLVNTIGKSCTLIGEGRRHLMKDVMKDAEQKRRMVENCTERDNSSTTATGAIRSRTIPSAVIMHFTAKILTLKPHIKEVLAAEAVARMDRIAGELVWK